MRLRYRLLWSAGVSDKTKDALNGVVRNFDELACIVDEALAKAARLEDEELIERLKRAKAALEVANKRIGKLGELVEANEGETSRA